MMKKIAKVLCSLAVLFVGTVSHGAPILLKSKTIVPGVEDGKARLMATPGTGSDVESLPERGLYIVQHDGIIQPSWRESLEAAGAIIRSYIPENAYLVEASPAVHEAIRTTIPHTYLGEYKGEYRYDAETTALIKNVGYRVNSRSGRSDPTREFLIRLFTKECQDEIVVKIGRLAGCLVLMLPLGGL